MPVPFGLLFLRRSNLFMPIVIESMEKLLQTATDASFLQKKSPRLQALEHYFSRKGIIQVEFAKTKGWPVLIYPPQEKIQLQIDELEQKQKQFSTSKRSWQLTQLKARTRSAVQHTKKLVDPLFWQHVTKKAVDKEYRDAVLSVGVKSKLIANEKYRPMMDSFVNNPKYRSQLVETVKTSPAYRMHEGLAKNADQQKELQLHISASQLKKTQIKLDEYELHLQSLRELLKWSQETHAQTP